MSATDAIEDATYRAPHTGTVAPLNAGDKPSGLRRCVLVFREARKLVVSTDPHATTLTVLQFALLARGQPAAT